jgi:hypothetical protein
MSLDSLGFKEFEKSLSKGIDFLESIEIKESSGNRELKYRLNRVLERVRFTNKQSEKFELVLDPNAGAGTLAYVKTNGDKKIYISPDLILDENFSKKEIKHVITHEKGHLKNRVFNLDLNGFSDCHLKTLLGDDSNFVEKKSAQTAFIEGFNESETIKKSGEKMKGVYENEVLAAKKIEEKMREIFGKSALEAFSRGDEKKLTSLLKKLSDFLLVEKTINENTKLSTKGKQQMWKLIKSGNLELTNMKNSMAAKDFVDEWVDQKIYLERLKLFWV